MTWPDRILNSVKTLHRFTVHSSSSIGWQPAQRSDQRRRATRQEALSFRLLTYNASVSCCLNSTVVCIPAITAVGFLQWMACWCHCRQKKSFDIFWLSTACYAMQCFKKETTFVGNAVKVAGAAEVWHQQTASGCAAAGNPDSDEPCWPSITWYNSCIESCICCLFEDFEVQRNAKDSLLSSLVFDSRERGCNVNQQVVSGHSFVSFLHWLGQLLCTWPRGTLVFPCKTEELNDSKRYEYAAQYAFVCKSVLITITLETRRILLYKY